MSLRSNEGWNIAPHLSKLLYLIALCLLTVLPLSPAHASSNGLAATPPMGWNSWNHYGCSGLNETVIEQTATAMVSSGMKAAGYLYVNLDDCWMAASRDANGNLLPDPTNFPSGMPALVSYVHNLGLKIGLYEDVGTATCEGRPGSYGHYQQDASTFASWGIDYIKMDWCNHTGLDPATQYAQFAQALTTAKANIVFSICDWGTNMPWNWAPALGNSWRTTPDISDNWLSMINNMEATSAVAAYAGPGAWNDPDMLEVGNGGMTDREYQSHFSMWAMLAAPLICGNNLSTMSAATLATLTNTEVIAVDQDALGKQGILWSDNGSGQQVWTRQVSGGTVVALMNQSSATAVISVKWSDLGLDSNQTATVRDLWAHADLGAYSNSFSAAVPSHGVTLLKIVASNPTAVQTVYEADASANTLSGAAVVQQCPGSWGYSCLDGKDVGWIGNSAANFVTINNVDAATSGAYSMTIYGAVIGTRTFNVSVNGGAATPVSLTGTSYSIPSTTGMTVQLNAGINSIQFSNPTAYAPDLDHIVLTAQGTVNPDFNIAYPTSDVTIASPGQSGTATITLVPMGGFTGNVAVSCSLPSAMTGATCNSTTATLGGSASGIVSLVITTAGGTSATLLRQPETAPLIWLPLPALALLGFGRRRKLWMLLLAGAVLMGVFPMSACEGGNTGSETTTISATPAGTYQATVTATTGTLVHVTSFQVIVQ